MYRCTCMFPKQFGVMLNQNKSVFLASNQRVVCKSNSQKFFSRFIFVFIHFNWLIFAFLSPFQIIYACVLRYSKASSSVFVYAFFLLTRFHFVKKKSEKKRLLAMKCSALVIFFIRNFSLYFCRMVTAIRMKEEVIHAQVIIVLQLTLIRQSFSDK